MTKKILLSIALMGTSLVHAEHSKASIKLEHNKHAHAVHWSYEGKGAPEHWGDIDPRFTTCKNGVNQSPIDLQGFTEAELPAIEFNYKLVSKDMLDNGHSEQVNVKEGSSITLDGIKFDLKQFHFHSPSENNINGTSFPLEAHFVHARLLSQLCLKRVKRTLHSKNFGQICLKK